MTKFFIIIKKSLIKDISNKKVLIWDLLFKIDCINLSRITMEVFIEESSNENIKEFWIDPLFILLIEKKIFKKELHLRY